MCEHRQKQEMVAREESKRTGSELKTRPPPTPSLPPSPLSPPTAVSEKTVLREVWVQEAALLVKQVITCGAHIHVHPGVYTSALYVCIHAYILQGHVHSIRTPLNTPYIKLNYHRGSTRKPGSYYEKPTLLPRYIHVHVRVYTYSNHPHVHD